MDSNVLASVLASVPISVRGGGGGGSVLSSWCLLWLNFK